MSTFLCVLLRSHGGGLTLTGWNYKLIHASFNQDRSKLKAALDIRLGPKAGDLRLKDVTKNKSEAANCGLTRAVPKHITFAQNYSSHMHAAFYSMNDGPATSMLKICNAVYEVVGSPSPQIPTCCSTVSYRQANPWTGDVNSKNATIVNSVLIENRI